VHRPGDPSPPERFSPSGVVPERPYRGVLNFVLHLFNRQNVSGIWSQWRLTGVLMPCLWHIAPGPGHYKHAYAGVACCVKNREARGHGTPSDLRPPGLRPSPLISIVSLTVGTFDISMIVDDHVNPREPSMRVE